MELLNKPIKINNYKLSNRLVMPPMATSKAVDGEITDDLINYYDKRTEGGFIGLVVTEHAYVNSKGVFKTSQVSVSKDEDIDGLSKLAKTIKDNGSCVVGQISHAGFYADESVANPVCVSKKAYENYFNRDSSRFKELSIADIKLLVEDYTNAAIRLKKAGFDGVEIHSAHGYLLNQFYSPLSNLREDEYGGNLDSRIKIHLEIIESIRKSLGKDFIIILRLGGCDYREGGSTIDNGVYASTEFEKAGVDCISVSGGLCGYIRKDNKNPGYFSDLSSKIKENISIPVILTGGITKSSEAEELLENEKADLIGVGRAIFKDSNWPKKEMKNIN